MYSIYKLTTTRKTGPRRKMLTLDKAKATIAAHFEECK